MSFSYFNTLNYTLANEDTRLELAVLPEGLAHVATVAGSGARAIPLLARRPKRLTCIDLSQEQLWLTELRVESVRAFELDEYLAFWGFPPAAEDAERRRTLFHRLPLREEVRAFFEKIFNALEWGSILYTGRWERTFAKISKIAGLILGAEAARLFGPKTLNEHLVYVARDFPRFRWRLVVQLVGNSNFFNALLYKGHFPRKNIPESFQAFYNNAFLRLFAQGPARRNFFLQLTFLGKLAHPEGNPVDCEPEVFAAMKEGLAGCDVRYVQGNLIQVASQTKDPIDFLSMSDVPSYFSEGLEASFLRQVSEGLSPRALVVIRYYLRVAHGVDAGAYLRVTNDHQEAIAAERTQMYHVDIFRRKA